MGRKQDYIFQRPGSSNWQLRLQPPKASGLKEVQKSLGTSDRKEAEIRALPHILEHKLNLQELRNRQGVLIDGRLTRRVKVGGFKWDYPLGDTTAEDGTRTIATEQLVLVIKHGQVVQEARNDMKIIPTFRFFPQAEEPPRSSIRSDDHLITAWVAHKGLNKHVESDARNALKLFRTITTKPLSECTRADGRALVQKMRDMGSADKTIHKKVGYLSAAFNLAMDDNLLTQNPFRKVMGKVTVENPRIPLSEDDVEAVRAHLCELRPCDQLLWNWLARCGMRLDEPFQITEEFQESGVRYVIVGSKTESSIRRVPIPTEMLDLLPNRITGPIFTENSETAGKRLRYFLRKLDIMFDKERGTGDKRKKLHCLRHRAADRLRAAECPDKVRLQLLGHDEKTVADGYGRGSPATVLLKWLNKIGM